MMGRSLLALLVLSVLVVGGHAQYDTVIRQEGYCAMYGECGTSDRGSKGQLPCAYNGPALVRTGKAAFVWFAWLTIRATADRQ